SDRTEPRPKSTFKGLSDRRRLLDYDVVRPGGQHGIVAEERVRDNLVAADDLVEVSTNSILGVPLRQKAWAGARDGMQVMNLLTHAHYGAYARAIAEERVPAAFPGYVTPDDYVEVSPELPPVNWNIGMRSCQIRHGMFASVDAAWSKELAARLTGMRVLEVMAGRGWLAKAMREHGVTWVATDDHSWWQSSVAEVEKLDAVEAVKTYRDQVDVLAISWPPYNDPIAE